MSNCSSELDVVKTRITTCDDDNGILYAYQSKAGYYANPSVQYGSSCEGNQKIIVDILNRCKIIQDSIQTLDKKFKTMHGKVSKIYRFRTKLIWQNRRPLGYAYKHYTYLLSRKVKLQKKKKEMMSLPASYPYVQSYSPTVPVRRPRDDSQSNFVATYCPSQDSLIHNDDQETRLSQSPTFPPYTQEDNLYNSPDSRLDRSYMTSYGNQGFLSSTGVFSAAQASTSVPAAVLEKVSSVLRKQDFPNDPSTWTVEEVILFLQYISPESFEPIADTFRQHNIDGVALLLLQSEVMIKHMGINLGTALKLCHYIEKLKAEKGIKV